MDKPTILLVDDEINVLSALARTLKEDGFFNIQTAKNGLEGLDILRNTPGVAVVVADYRMPFMNGVDFLVQARFLVADTTRILLTGVADLEMAVEAVNRTGLFRFLLKPCPPDVFIAAVRDGIRQNELVTSEHELLNSTLNGSIKMMIEVLAAFSPEIFARANRQRRLAKELAKALEVEEQSWEIELAALLCQIGAVTIPQAILAKWQSGKGLELAEREMVRSIPKVGAQFLSNIPRLENAADAVRYQDTPFSGQVPSDAPSGIAIPLAARILKVVIDFDRAFEVTRNVSLAYQNMVKREWEYDPHILDVFERKVMQTEKPGSGRVAVAKSGEKRIMVEELRPGMELARDVTDKNGILIVAKGTIVSEVLRWKLVNYFRSQAIIEPVFIESSF